MKSFAALALMGIASATVMSDAEYEFMNFVSKHNKRYGTKEEYAFRLNEFSKKLDDIIENNSNPEATSQMGINFMADWTHDEFKQMLGYQADQKTPNQVKIFPESNADSVDWVTAGAVTAVKNQASCGSCWAFSTTGAMEGAHFLAGNALLSLSEQQLVDCSKTNNGCGGGLMDRAFKYAEKTPLEPEADYPYKGRSLAGCTADASKEVVSVKSYFDVTKNSESQLLAAVDNAPVSVAIEADKPVFQSYTSGVITSTSCGTQLDHGVLVVGYGTDPKLGDYYLVKNSWGPSWGEAGYLRIGRNGDGAGICGIQSGPPSQPTTN